MNHDFEAVLERFGLRVTCPCGNKSTWYVRAGIATQSTCTQCGRILEIAVSGGMLVETTIVE